MADPRMHIEGSKIANHALVKKAFVTICAILMAYKGKDLEADVQVDGHQFHIEVTEVAKNE
jgi:hypothetical protein